MTEVINVKIKKQEGWYIATSKDLHGLVVAHRSFVKLVADLPECIKALYRLNKHQIVDVNEMVSPDNDDVSDVVFQAIKKVA